MSARKIKGDGIPTLSLFSGAGGLDLGFAEAGFNIVACVEIEQAYTRTLAANASRGGHLVGADIHSIDIAKFDPTPYKDAGIRCVIGGPPCQTFSAAGRRSGGVIGTDDVRGQLFLEYCRILDALQPEVFVFENVYGLPGANGGQPWRDIQEEFSKRGYDLQATVVDAADYGVPQHRERLIMVGSRIGKFAFPTPTHGPDSAGGSPLVSVESAIHDLQDPNEPYHDTLGGLYGHLLPLVPEGLNYSFFTAEMGHPEPVFAWRSKFHDLLYKVSREEPCRTLKAQPGKFTGPFHWKNRHFTIPELKRLQTFADGYELVGTFGKVLEQIGNSVPPRLAYVMAQSVKEQLLLPSATLIYPTRPAGFSSTFRQRQRLRSATFQEKANRAIAAQYGKREANPGRQMAVMESSRYLLRPKSLFDRAQFEKSSRTNLEYAVSVSETGGDIEISFIRDGLRSKRISSVKITGLRKYLPDYDTLTLVAEVATLEDVFHAWGAIEEALTKRSRFFSLIDIYGHYANRGDTVNVVSNWNLDAPKPVIDVLNFAGNTANCGEFVALDYVSSAVGVDRPTLLKLVDDLRAIRFDVRSALTHPIIEDGHLLCTYPFPLLSRRAMVESKVVLTSRRGKSPELGVLV